MVRYSYYYQSELNLHVVMVSRDNPDGTVAIRPVAAYYQAKSAQTYVKQVNECIAAGNKSAHPRFNPPIRYFACPDWWTEKYPNWNKMHKGR